MHIRIGWGASQASGVELGCGSVCQRSVICSRVSLQCAECPAGGSMNTQLTSQWGAETTGFHSAAASGQELWSNTRDMRQDFQNKTGVVNVL